MIWGDNFHSRFVAWMKIILPLVALGLLSTLFLISRSIDPTASIPFADIDLEQRAQDQGATNPSFAGVSSSGDQIRFHANYMLPDPEDDGRLKADGLSAQLTLNQGGVIEIEADYGKLIQKERQAILTGNVEIQTSDNYKITTERLETRYDELQVMSPGTVHAQGPLGTLEAGRMVLSRQGKDAPAELVFNGGVKVIYTPVKN